MCNAHQYKCSLSNLFTLNKYYRNYCKVKLYIFHCLYFRAIVQKGQDTQKKLPILSLSSVPVLDGVLFPFSLHCRSFLWWFVLEFFWPCARFYLIRSLYYFLYDSNLYFVSFGYQSIPVLILTDYILVPHIFVMTQSSFSASHTVIVHAH